MILRTRTSVKQIILTCGHRAFSINASRLEAVTSQHAVGNSSSNESELLRQFEQRMYNKFSKVRRSTREMYAKKTSPEIAFLLTQTYSEVRGKVQQHHETMGEVHYQACMLNMINRHEHQQQIGAASNNHTAIDTEAAFYFFGHALKRGKAGSVLWKTLFTACFLCQAPPSLFDAWLEEFKKAGLRPSLKVLSGAFEWCSALKDVERALKVFNFFREGLQSADLSKDEKEAELLGSYSYLITSVGKFDGGLRASVVNGIRNHISVDGIRKASWRHISRLATGMNVGSALQLVLLRSGKDVKGVPVYVWLSLLSHFVDRQAVAEAESLFRFFQQSIDLTLREQSDAITLMLKLYCTRLSPADFTTAVAFFAEHVLNSKDPRRVPATSAHYQLLIRAADAESATHLALEAMSSGVSLSRETKLLMVNSGRNFRGLTNRLPIELGTSELDEHLKIPADADSNFKREDAQRRRGKPFADSTGGI